jgi:hypothetical protein
VIVNHEALLVALQLQPAVVVTLAVLDPAAAGGFSEVGATAKEQGAACWLTVTVCPATVKVPVRGEVDVFAAMLKATVPLPMPLEPAVIVSQEALLVAVQLQPGVLVTVAAPDPAAAAGLSEVGATLNVHGAAPWFTVTVWPATVRVPVRGSVAAFAAMVKATVPLPLPLAPEVIVSQESLLVAVQLQPAIVVTVAALDPPVAAGFTVVGDTVNTHGAPCWLTVTVWPATVKVPVRGDEEVFAAMLKATVPLPEPLAPDVIVNQDALLVALQLQPALVVTFVVLDPALEVGFRVAGATLNVHAAPC